MNRLQPVSSNNVLRKRKNIDLSEEAFRNLSIKAAAEGTNLKKYIEQILESEARVMSDQELYRHLVDTTPEGKTYLDKGEKADFENWLGI